MSGDTDKLAQIEDWVCNSNFNFASREDVLALVEIAKAARDESLADCLPVIEHALAGGSPGDALRFVRAAIVKHRTPIRAALSALDGDT